MIEKATNRVAANVVFIFTNQLRYNCNYNCD
jgi:hypothetical protein